MTAPLSHNLSVFSDGSVREVPSLTPNVRRVRHVGTPVMIKYGYDVRLTDTGNNFQAIDTLNKTTGFGGISNFLRIPNLDLQRLEAIQSPDEYTVENKMRWLCKDHGTIYFDAKGWRDKSYVRWGTIVTGRFVWVDGYEDITAHIPNIGRVSARYARLRGFHRIDWDMLLDGMNRRPDFAARLQEFISWGLIHEVWCTYKGNKVSDRTPKGKIYSPFWSPENWTLRGPSTPQVTHLYIPEEQLE